MKQEQAQTPALSEPSRRERRQITRAAKRDRVRFRALALDEHTPWTRELDARCMALAHTALTDVDRQHDRLEQERAGLEHMLRTGRPLDAPELFDETATVAERHTWAVRARTADRETEALRAAKVRLEQVLVALEQLPAQRARVWAQHEWAYRARAYLYNQIRTAYGTTVAAASPEAPPFSGRLGASSRHPQLFEYTTAA